MSKGCDLSNIEKFNIVQEYDSYRKSDLQISQRQAANKLGISQPLLNKILKHRNEIETNWNCEVQKENRKIVLLVDNCTALNSIPVPALENIKVVYLLANTTSLIQPCDQGIINSFKSIYRREMNLRIIQKMDYDIYCPVIKFLAFAFVYK